MPNTFDLFEAFPCSDSQISTMRYLPKDMKDDFHQAVEEYEKALAGLHYMKLFGYETSRIAAMQQEYGNAGDIIKAHLNGIHRCILAENPRAYVDALERIKREVRKDSDYRKANASHIANLFVFAISNSTFMRGLERRDAQSILYGAVHYGIFFASTICAPNANPTLTVVTNAMGILMELVTAFGKHPGLCDEYCAFIQSHDGGEQCHTFLRAIGLWAFTQGQAKTSSVHYKLFDWTLYLLVALRLPMPWTGLRNGPPDCDSYIPDYTWDQIIELPTAKERFAVLNQSAEVKEVKRVHTFFCLACCGFYHVEDLIGDKRDPVASQFKLCGSCSTAMYCGQACQKIDWNRHKSRCVGRRRAKEARRKEDEGKERNK